MEMFSGGKWPTTFFNSDAPYYFAEICQLLKLFEEENALTLVSKF
jgi:hypothetical protein